MRVSGHSISRMWPSMSLTSGRTLVKSRNSSGSMQRHLDVLEAGLYELRRGGGGVPGVVPSAEGGHEHRAAQLGPRGPYQIGHHVHGSGGPEDRPPGGPPWGGVHRRPGAPHDRRAARRRRGRRRLRLHAQGPPDRAERDRPTWRSSCATAAARSPRACSATPTSPRGGSSAVTWCGCQGRVDRFRDELQLEVREIERATAEALDPAAFLPMAYRDLEELDGFLEHLAREVHDPDLRRLVDAFLGDGDFREAFRRAPCTRGGHHAYLGGLIEHTVAVATLVQETCVLHPRLDSDLLMAAAILHDVGKTREFTFGAEIALSEEGALLGHLALGQQMIVGARRPPGRLPARAPAGAGALRAGPPRAGRAARAGASAPPRRWRWRGSTRWTPRSRARSSTASSDRPARRARSDFERVTELLEVLGRAGGHRGHRRGVPARVRGPGRRARNRRRWWWRTTTGRIVACCSLHFRPRLNRPLPDAWIPDLVVDPGARRQGAGRALLDRGRAAGPQPRLLAADAGVRLPAQGGPPDVRGVRDGERGLLLRQAPGLSRSVNWYNQLTSAAARPYPAPSRRRLRRAQRPDPERRAARPATRCPPSACWPRSTGSTATPSARR